MRHEGLFGRRQWLGMSLISSGWQCELELDISADCAVAACWQSCHDGYGPSVILLSLSAAACPCSLVNWLLYTNLGLNRLVRLIQLPVQLTKCITNRVCYTNIPHEPVSYTSDAISEAPTCLMRGAPTP
jgi:hypothetical protein